MRLCAAFAFCFVLCLVGCDDGEDKLTAKTAKAIEKGCVDYKTKYGAFPKSLKELASPANGDRPIIEATSDRWGNPFQYNPEGPKNGGKVPDIWLVRPNGKVIGNWMTK